MSVETRPGDYRVLGATREGSGTNLGQPSAGP